MRLLLTLWFVLSSFGVDGNDEGLCFVASKKHHRKHHLKKKLRPHYSASKIDKILENVKEEGHCNELSCSSQVKVAKKCLKTKKLRNRHKKCFKAFCQYGCNERDYQTNPEVYEYCNRICPRKG